MIGQIIVLIVLILLSGIFSSTEIAMFTLSEIKIRHLVDKKVRHAKQLQRLKENTHRLLITILVGNNLVNIGSAAMATALAINLFGNTGVGIATGIMTLLILVFGEIIPKAYATKYAKEISLFMTPLIYFFMNITYPVVWIFEKITSSVVKDDSDEPIITEEEVRGMLKMSEEEGSIKRQEEEMIQNIFKLDDTYAVDIMTPRPDMFAIESNHTVDEVLSSITENGYSRIPIYEGDLDNIIGILYVKDILTIDNTRSVKDILRPAFFVPETKRIDSLLREFKQKKMHLAIVVNEHGTTVGVVSIEDLIEEIVGEIYDETDNIEHIKRPIHEVTPNHYFIKGKAEIEDVSKALKISISNTDSSTMSGFVMDTLNKVPEEGDAFTYKNFRFIVKKVSSQRVEQVEVIKHEQTSQFEASK